LFQSPENVLKKKKSMRYKDVMGHMTYNMEKDCKEFSKTIPKRVVLRDMKW